MRNQFRKTGDLVNQAAAGDEDGGAPTDGIVVLGRDDPGAMALAPLAQGQIHYFSAQGPVDDGGFLAGDGKGFRQARG